MLTIPDIIHHRLINQQIAGTKFTKPEEIVSYMGAMQAQDWAMAKWAIGLRLPDSKESDFEEAYNAGKILRTHVLRPTWHFVAPRDIKWTVQLTAPRVHQLNKPHYKQFDLDEKVLKRSKDILIKSLRDKNYKKREELNQELKKAKIIADRMRLAYIIMHAELEGLICSGPRIGKQFSYALLEERAPKAVQMNKQDALHELTFKYFKTRGPATINDFAWWSGLTVKEALEGINSLNKNYLREKIGSKEYIFYDLPLGLKNKRTTFLVPDFDEYGISYKDRSLYQNPKMKVESSEVHPHFLHSIVVDGYWGGNWKKSLKGNSYNVEIDPFHSLTKKQLHAIDKSVRRYMDFFGE